MPPPPLSPVTLEGTTIRLVPLSWSHLPDLCEAGLNPEIWQWTIVIIRTPEEMRTYIAEALKAEALGTALPFAIIERSSGKAIGSTRYGDVDLTHRRVQIGWTWISRDWQRTAVNTEAKYLLLRHAFESLGCIRVEFKTDSLNERSRAALVRIGAREEGTFRNHMIIHTGRVRHTVYYSIINSEWPDVKAHLERLMRRTSA